MLHSMQSCISDIKAWATVNMLKLHDNKTEKTKHLHNLPSAVTIDNAEIPFKQCAKNLGFSLDCHLTINKHVFTNARSMLFQTTLLTSHRFLTITATATLVSAFVWSRIDYCTCCT